MVQIRLTAAQRSRIKVLAARQNMTLQRAVVEAFEAWAEKLRGDRSPSRAQSQNSQPHATPPPPPAWLKQALRLDWTQCPEVESVSDGESCYWMLRESDAPLSAVLRALADGIPATEIAEVFELELPRLATVLEFAASVQQADTLN